MHDLDLRRMSFESWQRRCALLPTLVTGLTKSLRYVIAGAAAADVVQAAG
jgi:hypothetical protein